MPQSRSDPAGSMDGPDEYDETPADVQSKEASLAKIIMRGIGNTARRVVFDFQMSGRREDPRCFLQSFRGGLQTDPYRPNDSSIGPVAGLMCGESIMTCTSLECSVKKPRPSAGETVHSQWWGDKQRIVVNQYPSRASQAYLWVFSVCWRAFFAPGNRKAAFLPVSARLLISLNQS